MKRLIPLLIAVIVIAAPAHSTKIENVIKKFVGDSVLPYASVGICVYDIEKGKPIAGNDINTTCLTASTMKTLTWATAVEILGWDYRYKTPVKLVGNVDANNVFRGYMLVQASGDPTINSRFFRNEADFSGAIVNALKEKGIKEFQGPIMVTPGFNPAEGISLNWNIDDLAWDYGAGAFMFNFFDNNFEVPITITPDGITMGKTRPHVPDFEIADFTTTVKPNAPSSWYGPDMVRGLDSETLILVGAIKEGVRTRTLDCAVPNPTKVFIDSLQNLLKNNGIKYKNTIVHRNGSDMLAVDTMTLLIHQSPKLQDIAKSALYRSDNMFSEAAIRTIAYERTGRWDVNLGVEMAYAHWDSIGLDTRALFMEDGSGLSRINRFTPLFISKVLAYAGQNIKTENGLYYELIPVMGLNGTVRNHLKGTKYEGTLAMKSGSMNNVRCYAGYYPANNPKYTLAVLCNNFNCSSRELDKRIDIMLEQLLEQLVKTVK